MRRLLCVVLAVQLSCRSSVTPPPKPTTLTVPQVTATTKPPALANGRRTVDIGKGTNAHVSVELVDGRGAIGTAAQATELAAGETNALLARLEPLPDLSAQNAKAPTMRAPSPPPPRAGAVQPIAFAVVRGKPADDSAAVVGPPTPRRPDPTAPAVPLAPLAKPEISPTGMVEKEAEIRIRFSDAMVPVAAVGTSDKPVAVIAPAVAGTWRWIDTRVATFTAKGAYFANATEYTVTVPAGTKSLAGSVLAEPATQTFRTRPLTIRGVWPTGVVRPDSAIVVKLDQAFDPARVAPMLRVMHGKRALPYRIVTIDEAKRLWAKNPSIEFSTKLLDDHDMVIAPEGAWPAGVEPQIVLAKNAPSAEGPLRSERESYTSFTVAPAFTLLGITCGDVERPRMQGARCPMFSFMQVTFSNMLDPKSYRSKKVQIEGEKLEDHDNYGAVVQVWVPAGVGRALNVAISADLVDIYGQPLRGARRPGFVVAKQQFDAYVQSPSGLVIVDPRWETPQWVVRAEEVTALHVQLFQVKPSDYLAFEAFEREERATPPGKLVLDKFYPVGARHGATLRTDLGPHLGANGTGHLIAIVHAQPAKPMQAWTPKTSAWLQVTKLGASVRVDGERMNAYVQDVTPDKFLAPIADASVSLVTEGRTDVRSAKSDASGHVAFDLPGTLAWRNRTRSPTSLLLVQTQDDAMFTQFYGRIERAQRHEEARWYVTDDRFMYKPGEKVYVKGWVRWTHSGSNPDLALPGPNETVAYTLADNRGNKLASGDVKIGDAGGFDLEVELPANANQGTSTFTFRTRTSAIRHPIEIQEFRRPAFAVSLNEDVTHSGAAHLVLGEAIEMQATAKYYAGGGLPGAHIAWDTRLESASYKPPGWSAYTFEPKAVSGDAYSIRNAHALSGESSSAAIFGVTQVANNRPSLLEVDATVTDVDRMTIRASSRPILVHPSTLYVGARLQPRSYDTVELIVTDIDGNAVPGVAIDVGIAGVLWSERDRDDAETMDKQRCKVTSAAHPVTCKVTRKAIDWVYTATAEIEDARKRASSTVLELPWFGWERDAEITLVPDKKSYRPGDVAKIEIKSKQFPGVANVSFARQGVIAQKRVELTGASTIVELPIEPGWLQNVHVLVDRWADKRHHHGTTAAAKRPFPEILSAQIDLPVEVESARLEMRTRATRALVEPGTEATFEVEVKHDGKPVAGAEVALIVVDEAVLALSGKSHADPLAPFYRTVHHGTQQYDSVDRMRDEGHELAGKPGFARYSLDQHGSGTGGGGYGSGYGSIGAGRYGTVGHGGGTGIVISRKDFRATATFSPRLETDANGKVRLTVTMPDSLTRFRIVALATAETRYFGKAESAIVTQRKVNARSVVPRFLSQGDTFSLPVVVQNLDTEPRMIDVAARAANLVAKGPMGKRVTLQGGQRAEVRFDFSTSERGKAVVQTIAVSGSFADASNLDIPVYEPATTESFATYGIVDDAPEFERLEVPGDVFTDVGGVEVTMQSTQLSSLMDAYWYLYAYPYECNEQRSSRMIATTALYDVLDAFATPGRPTRKEIDEQAKRDLQKLAKDQNKDGGWGYFDGMRSDPYVTAQVLVALSAHKSPKSVTGPAIAFVGKQASTAIGKLEAAAKKPGREPRGGRDRVEVGGGVGAVETARVASVGGDQKDRNQHAYWVSLAAASLSVLATHADVTARATQLHATATALGSYPVDAKARLLSLVAKTGPKAMRQKLLADLLSATHETAATATVTTQYAEDERALLVSSTKTTALALDAIMREAPDHALVPKLARGILGAQARGRWSSTQENLVVLQTMRRFFDTYEKDTPSYTGKLWFGSTAYAEQRFVGRSTLHGVAQVDWARLPAKSGHDLALQKTGPGRMYYRVGITYAPKNTNLPALDAGFLVRRTYAAIDDPKDVVEDPDGTVRVRLGARVRVTLEAINSTDRHAVALVDPLPAGFEAVNDRLATSERVAVAQDDSHWDYRAHRDVRVEVFRMELPAGRHRYTYTARATTPGTFVAAPAKAEEMYSPETFGRSTGTRVLVISEN